MINMLDLPVGKASAVYYSGKYVDPRYVFVCMGKCHKSPYGVPSHCSDCALLLLMLSRVNVGEYRGDSMMPNIIRNNAIVSRWIAELDEEIRASTSSLPHLLDNAIQARGMSVSWQHMQSIVNAILPNPAKKYVGVTQPMIGLCAGGMAMLINTRAVPGPGAFRFRLHMVPHSAGVMLRELIMLPHDADAISIMSVIERHTLQFNVLAA